MYSSLSRSHFINVFNYYCIALHACTNAFHISKIENKQVEGLPETAKPTLSLQLSSPIEDRELTLDGEKATFEGVETSMATLTVDAKDADIPLGTSSNPIEIAPLCALDDPKQPKDEYVTEVPIAIIAAATEDTPEGEVTAEPVVCSVTLRVTYKPSPKDQREELYDLLNKTSQSKATALGELRRLSIEKAKAGASSADNSTAVTTTTAKPSVKPGFLNNKGGSGAAGGGDASAGGAGAGGTAGGDDDDDDDDDDLL